MRNVFSNNFDNFKFEGIDFTDYSKDYSVGYHDSYKDSYGDGESQNYDAAKHAFDEATQKQTSGELEEAIQLYLKSIDLYPTAEAHTFLGWAYSFKNQYEAAIKECRKAIEIDPDFGNPYNDIGSYLIAMGKMDEALPWLEKATTAKRYENYCYPHYNIGKVWEHKGDWHKAVRSYRSALCENSEYTLARRALNRIQSMMN